VEDDLSKISPEKRQRLAMERSSAASRKRRRSTADTDASGMAGAKKKAGEDGFIQRARVPQAITRDYTVRPESNVEIDRAEEEEGPMKKQPKKKTMFDNMQAIFRERRGTSSKGKHRHEEVKLSMSHVKN
jgi:hypothetical protein